MKTVTDFRSVRNAPEQIGGDWKLAIESFLNHCRAKNLREETIDWYSRNLNNYFYRDFVIPRQIESPSEFTKKDVEDYVNHTKKRCCISTVNVRLRAIRTFFNWLSEEAYIDKPIKVKMIKQDKPVIVTFSPGQMKKLVDNPPVIKDETSFASYRDYVMVSFLAGTGVRLGTLKEIRIADVDFVLREIRLNHTKNREEYVIPLSVSLAKILMDYIKIRGGDAGDYLFCNSYGDMIKYRTVQDRIKMYCRGRLGENADIRYSPHDFRHFFAVQYIRNGGDVLTLQKLLGHKTLEMTMRYVRLLTGDLKLKFAEFSPLDSIASVRQSGRKKIKVK